MRYIYILLTRSQTMISKVIHLVTGDTYTHASIAFDEELETLCSFARRNIQFPLPAGLVREDIHSGYYMYNNRIPCALLALPVEDDVYENAKNEAERMLSEMNSYHYNIRGLLLCRFGISDIRSHHYFCSQFVGKILEDSGALKLPKPASLIHPQDYNDMPQFICVYRGQIIGLTNKESFYFRKGIVR